MATDPGLLHRMLDLGTRIVPFIPTYCHLIISAVFPIWTGAYASLFRPASAATPEKKPRKARDVDDEDSDEEEDMVVQKMEGLSPSDAIVFPLMAGATLASLYFIIKWLKDPALLNKILGYYFAQMGLFFSIRFLKDALSVGRSLALPEEYVYQRRLWKINKQKRQFEVSDLTDVSTKHRIQCSPLPGILSRFHFPKSIFSRLWTAREFIYGQATLRFHIKSVFALKTPVDILDIASTILSIALSIYTVVKPSPWYLTNYFGFAFCYGSLQFMTPTTFWTGTLILSSLFFYDIYFVFFTPLMVTVATKLDVPIKLLFPRPAAPDAAADALAFAMLGLGDIVIPGMMIGLALRFDLYLHYMRMQKPNLSSTKDSSSIEKAEYLPATGHWGERLWSLYSNSVSKEISATRFTTPYFNATVIGYCLGMIITLVTMHIAEHAQPALLYLVPCVLGSLWGTAFFRGEIKETWNFSEEDAEAEKVESDSVEEEGPLDLLRGLFGLGGKKKNDKKKDEVETKTISTQSASNDSTEAETTKKSKPKKKSSKVDNTRKLIDFSVTLPKPKKPSDPSTTPENRISNDPASPDISKTEPSIDEPTANVTGFQSTNEGDNPLVKRAKREAVA